jgi:sortase A
MTVRVLLRPDPKPQRRRSIVVGLLRWMLLIAGVASLTYAGYAWVEARAFQAYEEWSFDQELAGNTPAVLDYLRDQIDGWSARRPRPDAPSLSPRATATAPGTAAPPPGGVGEPDAVPLRPMPDRSLIGRLLIPRLGVRAMVHEGIDEATLRHAVGHVPETVRPGVPGNVGLAAHRDTFFRSLKHIRKRDKIFLETWRGTYEYEVEELEIVGPRDVQVLAPSREPVLTLVTCYPFYYVGHAPRRFVVRARQISAGPLLAANHAQPGVGE